MNLFLYISEHSAHPPGLTNSLISGILEVYWRQNTHKKDFIHTAKLFYERLMKVGHKSKHLNPVFTEVAKKLHSKSIKNWSHTDSPDDKNRIFLHWPFHPKDVSRQKIRDIYESICESPNKNGESFKHFTTKSEEIFEVSRMTLAYSRPKNLRDLLSPTKLLETEEINVHLGLMGKLSKPMTYG